MLLAMNLGGQAVDSIKDKLIELG